MKLSNEDRLFLYGIIWVMQAFEDYMIFASNKSFGLCKKWGLISLEYIRYSILNHLKINCLEDVDSDLDD